MTQSDRPALQTGGADAPGRPAAPMPAELLALLTLAFKRVRASCIPVALSVLLAEVFVASLLTPVSSSTVDWLVRRSGQFVVANHDLAAFALSPAGVGVMLVSITAWVAGAFLGKAAALLALQSGSPRAGGGIGAFGAAVARGRSILVLAALQSIIGAALAAPFLAVIGVIAWGSLRGYDLYWFVNTRPPAFWLGLAGASAVGLAGAVVVGVRVLQWSIALPICLFERRGPRAAMRESRARLRRRLALVATARLGWLLACGAVGFVALAGAQAIGERALRHELPTLELTALAAGVILLGIVALIGAVALITSAGTAGLVFALWRRTDGRASVAPAEAAPDAHRRMAPSSRRTRLGVVVALGALLIAGAVTAHGLVQSINLPLEVELTAHRGAATLAPETTLASIRGAIEAGADRVEIDVMRSRDGAVVVTHDTDLRRIAGDPRRIADLSLEELQAIDVGSWFDPRFAGERIPTLEQVLAEVRGRATLNIELKTVGDEALLAQAVAEILHRTDRTTGARPSRPEFIVTALSGAALAALRRIAPSIPVGLVVTVSVGDVRRLDFDLLSVDSRIATPAFMARARASGRAVHVWNVRDPDHFTRLALEGAAGVITPDVRPLRARLDELRAMDDLELLLLAFRARLLRW